MSSAAPPVFSAPTSQGNPAETSGLQKVMWFGIIQLAALVSGWIGGFFFIGSTLTNLAPLNLGPNPTPSQVSAALGPLFRGLSFVVPLVAVIQVAAVLVLVMALRQLKSTDSRFSTPSSLTIILLVGMLVAVAGAVPLLYALPDLISQIASVPGTSVPAGLSTAVASLVAYFLLVMVGGLLSLTGLIGGQILGLWRVGAKYGETLLKLGAIFVVIPLLNIVAPVLVIVGAYQARGRVSAQV